MKLYKTIEKFKNIKIAVIGDLMLDRYIWGRASRISQEAPVPVVRVQKETATLGGAANVVQNILKLGGQAAAYGIVGDDQHGKLLKEKLLQNGADINAVITIPKRPTIVKTRVIASNQQVVRIDQEITEQLTKTQLKTIKNKLLTDIKEKNIQAVIVEDYAKGLLNQQFIQEICQYGKQYNIPIALDPHPSNSFKVKELKLFTPNRAEAFALANIYYRPGVLPLEEDIPLLEVGQKLQQEWQAQYLLITLGSHGMALFTADNPPLHVPTKAKEVFDVSGAGDTVMATFMLALLVDAKPIQAIQIANEAAGIVVGKVGTVPVEALALKNALQKHYHE